MTSDHLRAIDIAHLPAQDLREQPAPMLQWLKIADLRIDSRYQRPLEGRNWFAIKRIAANFDWCAFGPILCAPVEGGLYAVIDGQHRAHAAALCGIEAVPAMVVPVPPQKQALAFVQVNSGLRVSPHQTFRAELAANAPEALAMRQACADAGCEAMTYNPHAASKRPGCIYAIGLVRALVRAGRAEHLTAGLRAIRAYDTEGNAALYSDYVLAPWIGAIAKTGILDGDVLTAALHRRRPFLTLEAAERHAKETGNPVGAEKVAAFARQIIQAATKMDAAE